MKLRIRPACKDDARMLFEWANDPIVRNSAYSTDFIPWETHLAWFDKKLNSPLSRIFIGYIDNTPVGQVRFDFPPDKESEAVIDVSVASGHRGMGIGSALLEAAIKKLRDSSKVSNLKAEVKKGNYASARIFVKNGFREKGKDKLKGSVLFELGLE